MSHMGVSPAPVPPRTPHTRGGGVLHEEVTLKISKPKKILENL